MKIDYVLLIFSLIACINSEATLKAKIATEVKKKSLAKTDEISVTISNSGDAAAPKGKVTGFSLVCKSPSKTVQLECADTTDAIAAKNDDNVDGTATVKCTPAAAEDSEGTYVLTATEAKVGDVAVTVDDASKNVVLSATAESNTQTQTQTPSGSTDSGNYHKMSLVLYTIIALLF